MKPAFSLLELPLVAGIIAILVAVAMPNYMDAKLRAQIADVQVELNAVTGGILRYRVDTNAFPPTNENPSIALSRLERMEYLNFKPIDKFKYLFPDEYASDYLDYRPVNLTYRTSGSTTAGTISQPIPMDTIMCLSSVGPDGLRHESFISYRVPVAYDSSNGLRSNGDITKFVRNP